MPVLKAGCLFKHVIVINKPLPGRLNLFPNYLEKLLEYRSNLSELYLVTLIEKEVLYVGLPVGTLIVPDTHLPGLTWQPRHTVGCSNQAISNKIVIIWPATSETYLDFSVSEDEKNR